MNSKKKIAMVGCFDTKAEVFAYLYDCLTKLECEVITINTGLLGTTKVFPVHIERDTLLESVGSSIEAIVQSADRNEGVLLMAKAAQQCLQQLVVNQQIDGVIGMGGGGGSYIVLTAMQGLPFGLPKMCISTLATKDVTHLVKSNDVVLVPSIVDVAGLNSIISTIIQQAATSIAAMAKLPLEVSHQSIKRVAISMFGNTTACVETCTQLLTQRGYEVLAFHANGSGGRAMEELIESGYFDAVLDITTTELADELCGGICSAGSERLTAASRVGIPQIVVPGCLDMVNFGAMSTVPTKYADRNLYSWSPDVTLMRTNAEENALLAVELVNKLYASKGPVVIVIPQKGISKIDHEGSSFYDPQANDVLFSTLRSLSQGKLPIVDTPWHINDRSFAMLVTDTLVELLENT